MNYALVARDDEGEHQHGGLSSTSIQRLINTSIKYICPFQLKRIPK